MIKNLPMAAKVAIIELAQQSLDSGSTPTTWKRATIIALPKKGKDLRLPSSYRPVSLTSCIAKLVERLILIPLSYHLESNNLLADEQAGFRQNRSTEEQIARVAQIVSDGFQHTPAPHLRTLMVAVDFSPTWCGSQGLSTS